MDDAENAAEVDWLVDESHWLVRRFESLSLDKHAGHDSFNRRTENGEKYRYNFLGQKFGKGVRMQLLLQLQLEEMVCQLDSSIFDQTARSKKTRNSTRRRMR